MGANTLENAVWIFVMLFSLVCLGLGVSIVDQVFTNTTAMINQSLIDRNITNTSSSLVQPVYYDTLNLYSGMRAFWLDAIQFVIVILICFMFLSSFSNNLDITQYIYIFASVLFLSAIVNYLFLSFYNAIILQFTTLGLSTDAFFGYVINNYQLLLVFNIVGFVGNVIFQRIRYGVQG